MAAARQSDMQSCRYQSFANGCVCLRAWALVWQYLANIHVTLSREFWREMPRGFITPIIKINMAIMRRLKKVTWSGFTLDPVLTRSKRLPCEPTLIMFMLAPFLLPVAFLLSLVISPNHLFTTYQYILIWFLLASGDQRERLIHGQFSSQLCMLFMSLRISNGTFTLHFYCIFVFLSDILERLIRFSQLFVIRLWYVILWYTCNTGLVLGCTSVKNYLLSEYGQKPLTSSDESDDFLWF